MTQTRPEETSESKEQNAFIGRMFSVVVVALLAFGFWCGASILFTPLPAQGAGVVLFIRVLLMLIGGIIVGGVTAATARKLYDW